MGQNASLLRSTRGAVAVEFALIAPVLMLIILHLLDLGLAFNERMQVESAARAGIQYALHNRSDLNAISTTARNATRLDPNDLTVSVVEFCECPGGAAQVCGMSCAGGAVAARYMTVTVEKDFITLFSIGGFMNSVTLQGQATSRVQ